jgi:2-polyprenyl-3-methyl-5-hydroxy-6-metoxy-1,4-benzoquinol methylase
MTATQMQQATQRGVQENPPSPAHFFETMQAYQRSAALKTAIEIELFTAIASGSKTVSQLAQKCRVSERGVRALANFLVVLGFIEKHGEEYTLTTESGIFLDQRSPAYVGSSIQFIASPVVMDGFKDLTLVVRSGTLSAERNRMLHSDNAHWVTFAQAMVPIVRMAAIETEKIVRTNSAMKVLDIAAGHGVFGITVAQNNPQAEIVALDYRPVLEVAKENAKRMGVAARYATLPGDALKVPLGTGYDLILVSNLLHHWDKPTIEEFLRKVHEALAPNGRVAIIEFTPNEDRVSPPAAAAFVMNMLANTQGGDVYTAREMNEMLRVAGFAFSQAHPLPPTPQTVIVARK